MQRIMVVFIAAHSDTKNIVEFSEKFFSAMGIVDYEERESSNVVGEIYFKGVSAGITYRIEIEDLDGHEDMDYSIFIAVDGSDEESFIRDIENIMKKKCIKYGFRIARIINYGEIVGEQRIDLQ